MGKFIDMAGQRHGRLIVLNPVEGSRPVRWLCVCDCGKERAVLGTDLRTGKARSCGCLGRKPNALSLVRQRFGRWVVKRRVVKSSTRHVMWLCVCDCGEERVVDSYKLQSGRSKSCGCMQRDQRRSEVLGKTFGRWTVIGYPGVKGEKTIWRCRCSCGTERDVSRSTLKSGPLVSCGCLRSEQATIPLQGRRFGRWTVLSRAGKTSQGEPTWLCKCDCGTEREIAGACLRFERSRSCGCLRDLKSSERAVHGHARTGLKSSLYSTWNGMKQRCHNPNHDSYHNYGGRGVSVCARWRWSFAAFLKDVGLKPRAGLTLDRIDNDGNYEPKNVRWATAKEQASNTRPAKRRAA